MGIKCPKCQTDNPDTQKFCGECATPLPSSKEIPVTETLEIPKEELTTGSTFAGRYQIIEELGKGGMGKVYKAQDTDLKEKVAIKLLRPEIAADKKTIERFRNELKFARKIRHKNVCQMYDLNKEKGAHYITMEYVHGEDLKRLIRKMGQMSAGQVISMAMQVCEGMAEAHRLGVVHRDLKPQNIMVDEEGNARIMDFGIARSVKGKGITGAGVMIGTPEYMSPEQVEGKESDQRSDIYSLGVILYEMVTGRVPFEGDTPFTIGVKHKSEAPRNPKELNSQIPDDLSLVILRCMKKDKDQRYQSAGEVRSELENIEKGIPTTEKVIPKRKPITSKEITVTFGLKKLFIPALIVIFIAIVGVVIWRLLPQKEAVPLAKEKLSIAVLPFADLSPQKDQEHFCDGMTDEIIAKLSMFEGWKVISRTSVMQYKNTDKSIKKIGQELDVATILEGSVRKEKDDIRITAQLINVEDNFHIWSNIYDQKLEKVFDIQSDIADKIIRALKMKLTPEKKDRLQKKPTESLVAYNLYLQGHYFLNKRTEIGLKKGLDYFQQAIEKDPNYALAYAGLASSYTLLAGYEVLLPKQAYPRAKAAAIKALERDEMLAEAHSQLAVLTWEADLDSLSAEKRFKRAIELSPGCAISHKRYSEFLSAIGRHEEAIAEIKLAQELDPLSLVINTLVGTTFYYGRKYDQAIAQCREVLEMEPNFIPAHHYLGLAYIQKGMYEDGILEFHKAINLSSRSPMYLARLAHAYAVAGKRGDALRILDELKELSKRKYLPSFSIALIYAGLGEKEQAIAWLEKAYGERYWRLLYIKEDPRFDGLRSDPRFKALFKKIGL